MMRTNLCFTLQEYEKHCQKLWSTHCLSPSLKSSTDSCSIYSGERALLVYTDIPQIEEFLTRPEFLISMCYNWMYTCIFSHFCSSLNMNILPAVLNAHDCLIKKKSSMSAHVIYFA